MEMEVEREKQSSSKSFEERLNEKIGKKEGVEMESCKITPEETKFYIIESRYAGANPGTAENVTRDTIEIRTTPATTNSSHEKLTEGWCGTTNDCAVYAHGEYASIEEARAAITDKFGEVRSSDCIGDKFEPNFEDDEKVVEIYKPGKYEPMGASESADWAYDLFTKDVNAYTSDERISELVAKYEESANENGGTLSSTLEQDIQAYREELIDEVCEAKKEEIKSAVEDLDLRKTGEAKNAIMVEAVYEGEKYSLLFEKDDGSIMLKDEWNTSLRDEICFDENIYNAVGHEGWYKIEEEYYAAIESRVAHESL